MKKLTIAIPMGDDYDPLDVEILTNVEDACARAASTWTTPELARVTDGSEMGLPADRKIAYYECMAEPR